MNKDREVLMILQPRAIPEAIESLNRLDIDKVWFRGYTQTELEVHLNDFIEYSDYDYYWLIADDVIVDEKPMDLLRPLLYEGKVVSEYCKLSQESNQVNLADKVLSLFKIYGSKKHPIKNHNRTDLEFKRFNYSSVPEYMTLEEVESNDGYFKTYFTGWSFTGASKEVWLKYPFQVSVGGSQTDAQFVMRFVGRDGGEIWTHPEASHIHLKENTHIRLERDWIVGVQEPIIHFGDGKINGEDIDEGNVW